MPRKRWLLLALACFGCNYDFTIGQEDSGAAGPTTCSGPACNCGPGKTCDLTCSTGSCSPICAEGSRCNVACSAATCAPTCAANASCTFSCNASTCNFQCDGPCTLRCNVSKCTCTGPGCP